MANQIVTVNVTVNAAPTPSNLQKMGAFVSQGGTNTPANTKSLLTQFSDLTPLLLAPSPLASLAWAGGTATATVASEALGTGNTYNATTGLVTLNLAGNLNLVPGQLVTVSSLAGTGAFADAEGTFTCAAGTGTDIVTYFIQSGLSLTITNSTGTAVAGHGLTNGDTFLTTIAGAMPVNYNGTFLATATGPTTFTYALASDGGTTPATGTITYTPRNQSELVAMATTFFAQGSAQSVYVLELGAGEPAAGVTALTAWINNNPGSLYSYLIPRNWDAVSSFLTFLGNFENPTAKTYFFVTSTISTYTDYTEVEKDVFLFVEAPGLAPTEFSAASAFYVTLNYAPSPVNKVTPTAFSDLFGVTPYPTASNGTLLAALKAANVNYVGLGSEGGLTNTILFWGRLQDGNDFSYWYSIDWVQINLELALANAVINGSNNPINPLYYNQAGINTLEDVVANVMASGVSNGLVLGNVVQYELDPVSFQQLFASGAIQGQASVNAIPFQTYLNAQPGDFKLERYAGLSVIYSPNRGFTQIVMNVLVTDFAA